MMRRVNLPRVAPSPQGADSRDRPPDSQTPVAVERLAGPPKPHRVEPSSMTIAWNGTRSSW
jgi:hypothetical protein